MRDVVVSSRRVSDVSAPGVCTARASCFTTCIATLLSVYIMTGVRGGTIFAAAASDRQSRKEVDFDP